ncbi:MAG: hypothetical protein LBF60_04575 [Treponema sp.]|nr:hypothetical protein [Treponema sp.]
MDTILDSSCFENLDEELMLIPIANGDTEEQYGDQEPYFIFGRDDDEDFDDDDFDDEDFDDDFEDDDFDDEDFDDDDDDFDGFSIEDDDGFDSGFDDE